MFEARAAMLKQCEALSEEQRQKFTTAREEVKKIVEENNGEVEESKVEIKNLEEVKAGQGIPGFWLQAFKNHKQLSEMVHEKDEAALKHLVDVRAEKHQEDYGFTLRFEFAANDFFENEVLEKRYILEDSGARAYLVSADLGEEVDAGHSEVPALERVVRVEQTWDGWVCGVMGHFAGCHSLRE